MKLFVYGTLKYPEIVQALCGKTFKYIDVELPGYRVVALKNKAYPGLTRYEGYSAEGKLIDIDEKSFSIISTWEDVEYTPTEITIIIDSKKIKALTFLHKDTKEQLLVDWNEEYFRKNHLNEYVHNRIPKFLQQ